MSRSLPFYVRIAFTNPVVTPLSHIHEDADLAVRVIGHCIKALVVNKLAADIESRNVLVRNDEVARLSAVGVRCATSHSTPASWMRSHRKCECQHTHVPARSPCTPRIGHHCGARAVEVRCERVLVARSDLILCSCWTYSLRVDSCLVSNK